MQTWEVPEWMPDPHIAGQLVDTEDRKAPMKNLTPQSIHAKYTIA